MTISTVVGGGPNGGPATSVAISADGITKDADGNLFVSSFVQKVVLKISPAGAVSRFAGNGGHPLLSKGSYTPWADGSLATDVSLGGPHALAIDGAGNVFFIDGTSVRKVDRNGIITTAAGPMTGLLAGLAIDDVGNLFVADSYHDQVLEVRTDGTVTTVAGTTGVAGFSGDGGPATAATLRSPRGLAVDRAGNLFIADGSNQRVRKVDPDGIITTVAGGGSAGAKDGSPATAARLFPQRVAVDDAGNLLLSDYSQVYRVDSAGIISTAARLGNVGGMVADSTGLYIADDHNHRVWKVTLDGIISNIAGNGDDVFGGEGGPALGVQLPAPRSLAFDRSGNLYLSIVGGTLSTTKPRVARVSPDGIFTTIVEAGVGGSSSGDGGPAGQARLGVPRGLAVDSAGSLLIADSADHRIRKIDADGIITTVAGNGTAGFGGDGGPATAASLNGPTALAIDGYDNLYISDEGSNRIRKVSPTGTITTVAGTGIKGFDGDYGPATEAKISGSSALATDAAGNLYVTSVGSRVRRVGTNGVIITVAGNDTSESGGDGGATTANLHGPAGLAVDRFGALYISEYDGHRVRRMDANHIITTIAGTGQPGWNGDGGPAPATRLSNPQGLAIDGSGRLLVADSGSLRVRRVEPLMPPGPPTNVSATPVVNGALVSWDEPAYGGALIADYAVTSSPEGRTCRPVSGARSCTVSGLTPGIGYSFRVRATNAVAVGPHQSEPLAAMTPHEPTGTWFHPLVPTRLLDSRDSRGIWSAPLQANVARPLTVTGGVVPVSARAVVINVTITNATEGSYLAVFPTGQPVPTASNLNFGPGENVANLVTATVGDDGQVSFLNAQGIVDVIVDVVGFYGDLDGTSNGFTSIAPTRVLDSRTSIGGWDSKLTSGVHNVRTLPVTGTGTAGIPATASAVVLNVTSTNATAGSYLTVYPAGQAPPLASNLNIVPGRNVANLVTVKVGAAGHIAFFNAQGTVDVIADVVGFYELGAGDRFHALPPIRVLDDRDGTGLTGPWKPRQTRAFTVTGRQTIPARTTAVVANLTATNASHGTYLTAYPDLVTRPEASTLNPEPGRNLANLTIVKVGTNGKLAIYNAQGTVDAIADVTGYFTVN